MLKLIPIYQVDGRYKILYELLGERTPEQSISHKGMPSFEEHCEFVDSNPYPYWYFIHDEDGAGIVGSIYLTDSREIGISIFEQFRGNGYATKAIQGLIKHHPGRFLANINPANQASINLFKKFGARHIQNTYEFGGE